MKRKRYSSAGKLGRAWLNREIKTESIAGRCGAYLLVADPDTIWNGEKRLVLVRRHETLNLVMASRHGTLSLGKAALEAMDKSLHIPEKCDTRWDYKNNQVIKSNVVPRKVPVPFTYLDDLADDNLSSCDLATLQPLVMQSCKPMLDRLIKCFRTTGGNEWRHNHALNEWELEREALKAVGIDIPKSYEDRKLVALATRRLQPN
jgi:hypothetical protein